MIVYVLLLSVVALFTILDLVKVKQESLRIFSAFFLFLTLLLFAGLRYETGLDYANYTEIYDEVADFVTIFEGSSNYSEIHGEFLYLLFNSFVKTVFDAQEVVFFLIAFLGLLLVLFSCNKYSLMFFLSVYIYFCRFFIMRDMGQIRTAVAAGIILYSIDYVEKKQFWKFLLVLSVACSIHRAAIIMLPVYFISKYKWTNATYYISFLLAVVLGVMVPFKELFFIFSGLDIDVFNNYVFSEEFAGETLTLFSPNIIMQALILLFFLWYRKIFQEKIYCYNTMLNMYAVSTCWLVLFSSLGPFAGRVATMTATVEIFIIPAAFLLLHNTYSRLFFYVSLLAIEMIIWYMIFLKPTVYPFFVPYKTVFF